ncbi:reverse transcriptase domain-containing protein [Tanacetum coccineum]
MGCIQGVSEVMQISAFISNSKCLELARRFADQVPQTVNEMMKRVDDFVKSEEAYKNTELPKGEHPEKGQGTPYKGPWSPRIMQSGGPPRVDGYNTYNRRDYYQPYVSSRQQGRRPKEILATKLQLQQPPCLPMIGNPRKENLDRYYDYHGEKRHYTNDCYQLKRQLEVALESRKLNNLIKDVRHQKHKFQKKREEDLMNAPITFPPIPSDDVSDEPLIIDAEVEGYLVRRVFVDQGAAVTMMKFMVVQASSPHNTILGRTGMRELHAISSTTHTMMKFLASRGIATLVPRTAAIFKCRQLEGKQILPEEQPKEGAAKSRESSTEEDVMINPAFLDQKFTIETQFSLACRLQLINLLKDNKNVFAWQPVDMAGVNMKLNPKKCSFGVKEGKFLSYMVTSKGIRANPKKMKAVADMQSLKTLKEMQSFSGKLAAVNRFLSQSAEQAFQELKKLIMELPTLTTPGLKETLYVYLAASKEVVSGVLIVDKKGKQTPVRYVSRTLHEAERNYAPLEKLALCLLHISQRLRMYFEAHLIKVIIDQLIKQILNKLEVFRKLAKYALELGAYNITYISWNAVKGQVLTDCLNEEYMKILEDLVKDMKIKIRKI